MGTVYGISVGAARAHCWETSVVCEFRCYLTVNVVNSSFYCLNKIAHFVLVHKRRGYWLSRRLLASKIDEIKVLYHLQMYRDT